MNETVYINGKAIETDFFQHFNWCNFTEGDEVFLDDCDETDFLMARFWWIGDDGRSVYLEASSRNGANLKSSYRKSTV